MRRVLIAAFLSFFLVAALVSCDYDNSANDSLQPYLEFSSNGDGTASVMLKEGFSVTEVTIPSHVNLGSGTLEVTVFKGCEDDKCASSVKKIVFPETLTNCASDAFESMTALEDISFSGDVPETLTWDGLLGTSVEKEGYDFEGWQCNGHMIQPGDRICDYPDVTPVFSGKTYHIEYNLDGGVLPPESITSFKAEPDALVSVVLPVPSRMGYTFAGWFTSSSFEGEAVSKLTTPGDISLYAKWNTGGYIVRFLNYDGTELQTGTFEYGAVPVYNGATPLRAQTDQYSYEFSGWDKVVEGVTEDATYTAEFNAVPREYSVTLVLNGGTVAEGKNVSSYVYSTGAVLPAVSDISKDGYHLIGWYTDESCLGEVVTSISATEVGNKTFYAKYAAHAYDGGVITTDPTCTEEGVRTFTCSCGHTRTESIESLGHDFVQVGDFDTGYHKCTRCEEQHDAVWTQSLCEEGTHSIATCTVDGCGVTVAEQDTGTVIIQGQSISASIKLTTAPCGDVKVEKTDGQNKWRIWFEPYLNSSEVEFMTCLVDWNQLEDEDKDGVFVFEPSAAGKYFFSLSIVSECGNSIEKTGYIDVDY